jgi:hypothetical protein
MIRTMKSTFLPKSLLAFTVALSIFSFVFINTRSGLATAATASTTPLVEQALQPDDEQERELRLPDVTILGSLLKLVGRHFLPVGE